MFRMNKTMIFISCILLPAALFAQSSILHPTTVKKAVYSDVTPPLRNMHLIKASKEKQEREISNKTDLRVMIHHQPHPFTLSEDPVWQKENSSFSPSPSGPIQRSEEHTSELQSPCNL